MQAKFKREKKNLHKLPKTIEWSAHNKTAGGGGGGKREKEVGGGGRQNQERDYIIHAPLLLN